MLRTGVARLFIGLAISVLPVWTHAILLDSTPTAKATVRGPEIAVRLKFNSRIDAVRSRLYLSTTAGVKQVAISQQAEPDTLTGKVGNIPPGSCELRWQVLAVDGHITRGQLPFTVE